MNRTTLDLWVGLFVAIGIGAIVFLALRVGNLVSFNNAPGYHIQANFDNIGGLKVRAPVKAAGVVVATPAVRPLAAGVGAIDPRPSSAIDAVCRGVAHRAPPFIDDGAVQAVTNLGTSRGHASSLHEGCDGGGPQLHRGP